MFATAKSNVQQCMDLGHYTAGYKLYHKVAVPKKTDTLKPNFTINLLSKLA